MITVWHLGVKALAAALRALPECRDPAVPTSTRGLVPVYLGPQWQDTEDTSDCIVVGYADDGDAAGDFDQDVATLAAGRPRDESGTIQCLASGYSGDEDPTRALDAAFGLLELFDAVLRTPATASPDLGLVAGVPLRMAEFRLGQAGAVRWEPGEKFGVRCNVEFTVTYKAKV